MATRRNTLAKREQLRRELSEACHSGSLAPGEMVPSLGELTARYGLSNGVVHQEIKRLTEEGVLYSVPRVGTFVAHPPTPRRNSVHGQESDTVAVLSPDMLAAASQWHPSGWAAAVDQGAAQALHRNGYHVLSLHRECFLCDTVKPADLDRLTSRHLAGLIITDTEGVGECLRVAFQKQGLPVVTLDNHPIVGPCDRVVSDHEAGAYELTRWLITRKQRRILNCWPEGADGYWFALRRAGYEKAMREAGLEPLPPIWAPYARPDSQEDFDGIARILAGHLIEHLTGPDRVDTLMLASDGYTPLTAAAIRLFGLLPNQDILLSGYDNYWANMQYREYDMTAPVVTMDKGNWEMGEAAAGLLLERGRGQLSDGWQQRVIPPRLIEIDSRVQSQPSLQSAQAR